MNPKALLCALSLLAVAAPAHADSLAYVGLYVFDGGRACVGAFGNSTIDPTSRDCPERAPNWTASLGSHRVDRVPGLVDVVVGVNAGGQDRCFSVGTGGVDECEFSLCRLLHVYCRLATSVDSPLLP